MSFTIHGPEIPADDSRCPVCGLAVWPCLRKQSRRFQLLHNPWTGQRYKLTTYDIWMSFSKKVYFLDNARLSPEQVFWEYLTMKDEMPAEQKKAGKWKPHPEPFFKPYPHINAYLSDCWYDSGKQREVCKLSISLVTDNVTVSLNDNAFERSMTTTAATLQDALQSMEKHIEASGPAWRYWKGLKRK